MWSAEVDGEAPSTARGARALPVQGTAEPKRQHTKDELDLATERENKILAYRAETGRGVTTRKAAKVVGEKFHTLYNWCKTYDAAIAKDGPGAGLEALLPERRKCGRKRKAELQLSPIEVSAIRANKILNNRDKKSGSTPLAIRKTIEEGGIRPELGAELLRREAEGMRIVNPSTAVDLHVPELYTRTFRNARNTWLDFNCSPGSLQMTRDEGTGEGRLVQPGEWFTIDDGTKNFICTVPMERRGDKCWQKFQCIVGRWQILLMVDHASYMITGISHTARPKSSYRAEDLQATMHIAFKQHGRWKKGIFEKGISKANLLHHTLDLAGVAYKHVNSPHQKVVEFIFNSLWSRLSFLPGQVGRTRGEEAEVDALVRSCVAGATDPRDYFLPLHTVLSELRKVCEEWNSHRVNSKNYGSWVPKDFFAAEAPKHLRELHPSQEWMFSPTVADNNGEGYLVRKQSVTTSYLVMPGYSWVFDFEAPFLQKFYGARVRLHFNAFEPECPAKVVLQAPWQGVKAGTPLGDAEQINMHTRHSRRLFGIEECADIGLERTRQNAQALRRNTFAIRPDGKPGVASHEARNGLGESSKVTNFPQAPAAPDLQSARRERDRLSRLANDALVDISD